ncbi:hypothetical protein E2C01_051719 [Portunus trituberculatus]|uniref:Uncharacterized protein n=1 Tax=Portunus trituberculatus TaxID=210409 RepID=A0A5B7GFN1_PORTR|nr:hypothetical protein [Portunus trituberculatus]
MTGAPRVIDGLVRGFLGPSGVPWGVDRVWWVSGGAKARLGCREAVRSVMAAWMKTQGRDAFKNI